MQKCLRFYEDMRGLMKLTMPFWKVFSSKTFFLFKSIEQNYITYIKYL